MQILFRLCEFCANCVKSYSNFCTQKKTEKRTRPCPVLLCEFSVCFKRTEQNNHIYVWHLSFHRVSAHRVSTNSCQYPISMIHRQLCHLISIRHLHQSMILDIGHPNCGYWAGYRWANVMGEEIQVCWALVSETK